ncbi:MAG: hypothetical protein CML17_07695 [Pusillimonas sp.]|nr:hypothetical protein [Pusillimonas sp.]
MAGRFTPPGELRGLQAGNVLVSVQITVRVSLGSMANLLFRLTSEVDSRRKPSHALVRCKGTISPRPKGRGQALGQADALCVGAKGAKRPEGRRANARKRPL